VTPEEFRRHGRAVVDLVADYMEQVESLPVRAQVEPGWVRAQLPAHPPEEAEPFTDVLADIERVVLPGLTHWQHPSFFAYFPANASGPSILGELLSAGLGVQGMLWATSPAVTELETHVLDWLREMLDLPQRFSSGGRGGGVIADSASDAVLCALLAAREQATGGAVGRVGVDRPLVVYASEQAHSSVEKAVRIAGLGSEHLRLVGVDEHYAMDPEALDRMIDEDVTAGRTPVMVVATVGTTSSAAIDPLPAIGEICRRHGVWLHVDAAYAGTAAVCPELRWIHDGVEAADSYACNPHKWLLTNFDCTAFYVADRGALVGALSVLPEYLRNAATESGAVIDYRDWQISLGRRFRALKLWFVIRSYGQAGLRAHIRGHVDLAGELAGWVAEDPMFAIAAPPVLGLVCFRHVGGDALTERLITELNDEGSMYLTHTRLDGSYTARVSIGGVLTERRHVQAAWERITAKAQELTAAEAEMDAAAGADHGGGP
jgi:aromatic-L-amino-acid/L-tryptophan decarboxylase